MANIDASEGGFDELRARSLEADTSIYGTGLWASWHDLAEAKYEPAKRFFIERLQDSRWDWRRASVSLLGFHYALDDEVIQTIRNLLRSDTDAGVRISAASVLGSQGRFPEKRLIEALNSDPDRLVRQTAYSALLDLAKVPYDARTMEWNKVRSGEKEPSLDQLRRVLYENGLSSSLAILDHSKD